MRPATEPISMIAAEIGYGYDGCAYINKNNMSLYDIVDVYDIMEWSK